MEAPDAALNLQSVGLRSFLSVSRTDRTDQREGWPQRQRDQSTKERFYDALAITIFIPTPLRSVSLQLSVDGGFLTVAAVVTIVGRQSKWYIYSRVGRRRKGSPLRGELVKLPGVSAHGRTHARRWTGFPTSDSWMPTRAAPVASERLINQKKHGTARAAPSEPGRGDDSI